MHQVMFVLLASCLIGAGPVSGDLKKVQGTWQPTAVESDGAKLEQEELAVMKVIIDGDKYTVTRNGETIDQGALKLQEDKSPKQFDDTSSMGEHKGQTMKGIYELKGDVWKVCLAMPGKPRPKDYSAGKGSGHVVYIMKRAAK